MHFLGHWSADPKAFDDVLEEWVDNFLKPERLEGGFPKTAAYSAATMAPGRANRQPSAG